MGGKVLLGFEVGRVNNDDKISLFCLLPHHQNLLKVDELELGNLVCNHTWTNFFANSTFFSIQDEVK